MSSLRAFASTPLFWALWLFLSLILGAIVILCGGPRLLAGGLSLLWGCGFLLSFSLIDLFPIESRQPAWTRWVIHLGGAGLIIGLHAFLVSDVGPGRASLAAGLLSGVALEAGLLFVVLSLHRMLRRVRSVQLRQLSSSRLQTRLAMANLEVLKMQLQPHFLLNTLNAISSLMHRDVDAADRMITLLSDLLRQSLEDDDRHQVTLDDEISFLNRYLAIERIRFRDRLQIEVDVESECRDAYLPRLILQPLAENAIKHGIAMRSAAGSIAIRARRTGDRLHVEIDDDGPGLQGELKEIGVSNSRSRLEQIYGEDHTLELTNRRKGGMRVILEVPWETTPRVGALERSRTTVP